jgi:hypothetical protein
MESILNVTQSFAQTLFYDSRFSFGGFDCFPSWTLVTNAGRFVFNTPTITVFALIPVLSPENEANGPERESIKWNRLQLGWLWWQP